MIMNNSNESGHPDLMSNLTGKTVSFLPLSIILAVNLLRKAILKKLVPILILLKDFNMNN